GAAAGGDLEDGEDLVGRLAVLVGDHPGAGQRLEPFQSGMLVLRRCLVVRFVVGAATNGQNEQSQSADSETSHHRSSSGMGSDLWRTPRPQGLRRVEVSLRPLSEQGQLRTLIRAQQGPILDSILASASASVGQSVERNRRSGTGTPSMRYTVPGRCTP